MPKCYPREFRDDVARGAVWLLGSDRPWSVEDIGEQLPDVGAVVAVVGTEMRYELSRQWSPPVPPLEECVGSQIAVEIDGHLATFDQGMCPTSTLNIWPSGRIALAGDGATLEKTVPLDVDPPTSSGMTPDRRSPRCHDAAPLSDGSGSDALSGVSRLREVSR